MEKIKIISSATYDENKVNALNTSVFHVQVRGEFMLFH